MAVIKVKPTSPGRRGVVTSAIPGLEQGRVFSGREALTHRLVDEIGGGTFTGREVRAS